MAPNRLMRQISKVLAVCCFGAALLLLLNSLFPGAGPPETWRPKIFESVRPVRVLCWILTQPASFHSRARAVSRTWARRCDAYFFLSSATSAKPDELPIVSVEVKEGRDALWIKTRKAFEFIYAHYLKDYDFFLKADDDTFVIMENLRYFLRDVHPSQPVVTGRRFRPFTRDGYMSGGGSYVLSRAAVSLLVEKAFKQNGSARCLRLKGPEDLNMGNCLDSVGVKILDSLDEKGRERFHPLDAKVHVNFDMYPRNVWLWYYNYHPIKLGMDCCSDTAISFHYIDPMKMVEMHYLIYQLRPYGLPPDSAQETNKPLMITATIT